MSVWIQVRVRQNKIMVVKKEIPGHEIDRAMEEMKLLRTYGYEVDLNVIEKDDKWPTKILMF